MSILVSNPFVIVLFFLVLVMAYLIYLCSAYRNRIDDLVAGIESRNTEIRSLKRHINNKENQRKLYIFKSATDHIENVVYWKEHIHHLRLTLDDGSLYFVSTPAEYKLIIQDQSDKEN